MINFTLLSVNPDSKFQSVADVVAAMKSAPDTVTIATGGINSAGGASAEALKAATGGDYKMVTYDGGNPAVMARSPTRPRSPPSSSPSSTRCCAPRS